MKLSRWIIVGAVLAVAAAVSTPFVLGWGPQAAEPVTEKDVTIDQVPEAVKATILKEAGGNTITEIEEETKNGVTVYEAEWLNADGKEVEIKVAADGTLLKTEIDDDDEEGDDDDDDDDDDDEDDD
ncbi:MAG: hypothetical protein ISS74_06270 [Planctomycetes bacterium]|nr:hypothetical protein [Planctomycetota bacterium]